MRFVGLALIIFSIFPLVYWLNQYRRYRPYAWAAIGFLPFVIGSWNLDAALIAWPMWPGHTKGMLISLLDVLAVAILITHRKNRGFPPFAGLLIAYIAAALVSVAFSAVKQASFFYVWQLLRVLVVMCAVCRIMDDERAPRMVVMGMAAGMMLEGVLTVYQRGTGMMQAIGTMGHQNLLGMVLHFALYPSLALFLGDRKQRWALIGVGAGMIAVALTGSRAAIALAAVGSALTITLSIMRHATGRKMRLAGLGVLALLVSAPIALGSLEHRFANSGQVSGSDEERQAFERAAKMMWADHPMGVGANRYVVVANSEGYSDRAGVIPSYGSRAAHVHNTYLLTAAEMGYLGLITFVAFLVLPLFGMLRYLWQDRTDRQGEIVVGVVVAFVMVIIHCFFEWVTVVFPTEYMMGIAMGIASGLILARKHARRRRRRIAREQHYDEVGRHASNQPVPALR